jgi:hypothetical protein
MTALFHLCGHGYIVLIVALYLPALHRLRRFTRTALIVFTGRYSPRVLRDRAGQPMPC